MTVSQVNVDPLIWLRRLFGGSIGLYSNGVARDSGRPHNDIYWWTTSGPRARGVAMTLYYFMSDKRRKQIRKALGKEV